MQNLTFKIHVQGIRILLFLIYSFTHLINYSFSQQIPEIFQKINNDVLKNSKGYDYLEKLTSSIGNRYTGSDNGRSGEEYVYSLFKSIGFDDVRFQQFDFPAWIRVKLAYGMYINSKYRDIQIVHAAAYSNSPIETHVSNRVIDAGNGLEDDFSRLRKSVRGRIVLINSKLTTTDTSLRDISIQEKAELAFKYKAKAIVFIDSNQRGSIYYGKLTRGNDCFPIPVYNISKKDGDSLRKNIQSHVKYQAVMVMNNYSGNVKARNIIATLKGTELPKEYIIIGGHLDSWDSGTGALDNGLGSMEILDIARTFKTLKTEHKRTIIFINFMGDEQYLYGSRAYVKMLKDSNLLKNVKAYINLDNSGNPVGFYTTSDDMKSVLDSLGRIFSKIDNTFKNINKVAMSTGSDHQPFMIEGIPVCNAISRLHLKHYDCYHSDCDNIDIINKEDIINQVRFTTMLLYCFANMKNLPPQLSSDQTKAMMVKLKLKESLIFMDDWHW